MALTVECGGCGKSYRVDERIAGKKVRCKSCGGVIAVAPKPPPAAEAPAVEADPFEALVAMERNAVPIAVAPVAPPPIYSSPQPQHVPYAPRPKQPSRFGRNPNPSGAIGTDTITPWLVIAYVVTQIVAALYQTFGDKNVGDTGTIWAVATLNILLFFAVLGPAVYLGVFIMSKIFRSPMVELPYFRGCGVAALPTLMVVLALLVPRNLVLIGIILLAIVPVMFFVLRFVFDLDWVGALVSFAFGGIFYLAAQLLTIGVIAAAVVSAMHPHGRQNSNDSLASTFGSSNGSASQNNNARQSDNFSATPTDFEAIRLDSLHKRVLALSDQATDQSREKLTSDCHSMETELEALRTAKGTDPTFIDTVNDLKALRAKADAALSERPGPEIGQLPPATETWTAGNLDAELGPEVSYREYMFKPPATALVNLGSSENDAKGLAWEIRGRGSATLTIALLPNRNPAQRRPWTPTKKFQRNSAESNSSLYWLDATEGNVSYGTINGLAFTRVASSNMGRQVVKYAALDGSNWLTVELSTGDGQLMDALDASVRTLRKSATGEPKKTPYSPQAMVQRLKDDPDRAATLLRRSGPQAEDALIAGLADPDRNLQRHCVSLLQEVATVKSIPALKQIASEKHSDVADTARTILHRLDPEHNNAITDLLSELDSQQMMSKREPLEKLSAMTPDDHYRAAVVDKAKQLLLDRHGAFFNGEAAGKVLITWANDPKIVPEMLSLLNQDGDRNARHAAMQVLANLKDKRAVIPILRWLLLDSEPAIDALKQMGPMVETDVAVHLRDKEPAARLNAARVLEAVGSPKSYEALNRAAHDSRDLAAKEAAQAALDAIKERTASKPATTTPAPR